MKSIASLLVVSFILISSFTSSRTLGTQILTAQLIQGLFHEYDKMSALKSLQKTMGDISCKDAYYIISNLCHEDDKVTALGTLKNNIVISLEEPIYQRKLIDLFSHQSDKLIAIKILSSIAANSQNKLKKLLAMLRRFF